MPTADTITSTADRLRSIYRRPGPYLTAYVRRDGDNRDALSTNSREQLLENGVPPETLDALDARLSLPAPDEVSTRAVVVAADGSTIVDNGMEGPADDTFFIDTLPYAAPLMEWQQMRIAHLVVTSFGDQLTELVEFLPSAEPRRVEIGPSPDDAAEVISRHVADSNIELVLLGGDADRSRRLLDLLTPVLPVRTTLEVVEEDESDDAGRYADAVVRHIADVAARRTVAHLREFRFLRSHAAVAEGPDDACVALTNGDGDLLLIHDDPRDRRRVWFDPHGDEISTRPSATCTTSGRLVDAAIRSAVVREMQLHIVPSTGENGPLGDIAVLRSTAAIDDTHTPPANSSIPAGG